MTHIDQLNRHLKDSLGSMCGGYVSRFSWRWAPEEPWFVYSQDDRTLMKKSWAAAPSPAGGTIGRAWVLGEWRRNTSFDHHGYGTVCGECNGAGSTIWSGAVDFSTGAQVSRGGRRTCRSCSGGGRISGIRIPVAREWAYAPYFETAVGYGRMPTAELNANYIRVLDGMIQQSAMENGGAMDELLAEEKYAMEAQNRRGANEHLEASRAEYDRYTGAFGNLEPGCRDGFFSFQNVETSPVAQRLSEAAVA